MGTWWDNEDVNMFFPWGEDEKLAERLSLGYKTFAEDNDLLGGDCDVDNGAGDPLDLCLNGYFNGGGFIFDNWDKNNPPKDAIPRPNKSSAGAGLVYEWNGIEYFTRNGNNNRIQAFGGCAVNTTV